jgi:choline kinase
MRAIILAAGRGARLNGAAGDAPKCLLRVGRSTLLERQIGALRAVGIDDVVVVVGCQAERVRRACGPAIRFIENPHFAETNSLYSLSLARALLLDGFVVMNGDVLFHPQLLEDLVTARHEDALLVAYRDDDAPPFGDEEMKVTVRRGRVVDIAKTLDVAEADGENVGVARFGRDGAHVLVDAMDRVLAEAGVRQWVPAAFREFTRRRPLHVVGTRGFPWTEIDFPDDYRRAVREVLPAIESVPAGDEVAPGAIVGPPTGETRLSA